MNPLTLLLHPQQAWTAIAGEKPDTGSLYRRQIAPLAAVAPLSILGGLAWSGGRYLGAGAIVTAVTAALVSFLLALALPLAAASVLSALASRFKAHGGIHEALALLGYALTPFWLSGMLSFFALAPLVLAPLVALGMAYALYLVFLGAAPVMGVPADQRVPFTLIAAISLLATSIALNWLVRLFALPSYGFSLVLYSYSGYYRPL